MQVELEVNLSNRSTDMLRSSVVLTDSSSDCCGRSSLSTAWDESLCSLPGAFLACCVCGAEDSLGFRRLTIWNGALFNVAYAETSWHWDLSHIPPPRCSHSLTHVCQISHKLLSERRLERLWFKTLFSRSCFVSFWRSLDVVRDRNSHRRFRGTEKEPRQQPKTSKRPRFLHIIRVLLTTSSPLPSVFAGIWEPFLLTQRKTILWYHFTDNEHVTEQQRVWRKPAGKMPGCAEKPPRVFCYRRMVALIVDLNLIEADILAVVTGECWQYKLT